MAQRPPTTAPSTGSSAHRPPSHPPLGRDGRPLISQVPYLPGLDGVRAIAVVAVMIYHANHSWLKGGYLGVEVFFVISGYLITLLLIGEHERTGRVDLRQFWIRRFRRLLPALFVMMALLMVYLVVAYSQAKGNTRGDLVAAVLYGSNWFQIWSGAGYTAGEQFAPLRHLWSLAVEEQFYVLWPLVMTAVLARGRRNLPKVALWMAFASVALAVAMRFVYFSGVPGGDCVETPGAYWTIAGRCISKNDALYLSTITRAGGLLLGAAFAMLWRPGALARSRAARGGAVFDGLAVIGFAALAVMFVSTGIGPSFDALYGRMSLLLAAVATLAVVAAVTHPHARTSAILGNPALLWIGTRSYGLYLYHWPIYQIIRKQAGKDLTVTEFVVAMLVTAALTEASYRFIETPIRKGVLGDALRRHGGHGVTRERRQQTLAGLGVFAVVASFAAAAIAVAPLDNCVGDIGRARCARAAFEAEEAARTSSTAPAPASTPGGTDPLDSTPASTEPPGPTTTPIEQRAPIAVGESVMLGAFGPLRDAGFTVFAEENRGPNWVRETLQAAADGNQLGTTVVVQVGTNGPVSQEQYDAIVAVLVDVPKVVFLTVQAPADHIAANNELIKALPGRYPNVTVADWQAVAVSSDICDDGIHVSCGNAATTYANVIFTAVGRTDLVT